MWILIFIFGRKVGFEDDFGQSDTQEKHYFTPLLEQMPLRNSITMATAKIPGDQKVFEIVCYMLIQKVTKFHFPTPDSF